MSRNPHAASLRAHKPKAIPDKRDGNLIAEINNDELLTVLPDDIYWEAD
jgi:hypothetical protein